MADSPTRDQRILLRFLRGHYAARERPRFIAETIAALPGVVPAESCWLREFTRWPPQVTLSIHPPEVKQKNSELALERHLHEHPGIAYRQRTLDPQAIQLSDFLTTPGLHRTALYREFYRPMGVEYQISVALSTGPATWVVVALGRAGSDFSARDRRCLNVLLPHLVEGYRSACALSTHRGFLSLSASDAGDANLVILNNATRARFVPPGAQTLLTEYFGSSARSSRLPDSLERWFRHHARARDRELPLARLPFIVERPGKRLVVRLFSDADRNALFLQEEITDHFLLLRSLGLTTREAQILNWLAQGKNNSEISAVLGIRPRTVGKHLERIFLKFDVESRTAAVLKALGVIPGIALPPEPR